MTDAAPTVPEDLVSPVEALARASAMIRSDAFQTYSTRSTISKVEALASYAQAVSIVFDVAVVDDRAEERAAADLRTDALRKIAEVTGEALRTGPRNPALHRIAEILDRAEVGP